MSGSSDLVKRLKQQNHTALLHAVAEITQAVIVERSGLSATMVSRLLSGKDGTDEDGGAVERVLTIAAACNLKLVPKTYTTVGPDEWRAMQILARRRLDACAIEQQ